MKLPFRRFLRHAFAAGLLALLPSCQTPSGSGGAREFPTPGADWKTSIGQLRYVNPKHSVIGEAIVSRHGPADFALDFLAGPGVPLMRLRESGNDVRAEGLFARGSWQGHATHAGRLTSWVRLREAFAALDSASKGPRACLRAPAGSPTLWTVQAERAEGKPQRVTVEFPKTQERFMFVFAR